MNGMHTAADIAKAEEVLRLRAERDRLAVEKQIFEAERELTHRENAADHLRGVPARRNRDAIARLYDRLNALHVERLEGIAA